MTTRPMLRLVDADDQAHPVTTTRVPPDTLPRIGRRLDGYTPDRVTPFRVHGDGFELGCHCPDCCDGRRARGIVEAEAKRCLACGGPARPWERFCAECTDAYERSAGAPPAA